MEKENHSKEIPFLDVMVKRNEDLTFQTKVYRKPTHTDRYLDFKSHHPKTHKIAVARSLHDRAVSFTNDPENKHLELERIEKVLTVNQFPKHFIRTLKHKQNRQSHSEPRLMKAIIPYIQGCAERISRLLHKFKIRTYYKPINKLSHFFKTPKDNIPISAKCGVVYEIPCSECDRVYVGQTKNSLHTRVNQHRAACRLGQPEKSALAEHSWNENHVINWDGAHVLKTEDNYTQRLFLEAALTSARGNLAINRCEQFYPSLYSNLA